MLQREHFHSNLVMQFVREKRRCISNATGRRGRGYRQEHTSAGGGAIDAPPRSRQSAAVYMRSVEERKGMADAVTAENEAANALPGKSETRRAGSAARPVQMRRTDTRAAPRNGKAEEEMVEDRRVSRVQLHEGAIPPQASIIILRHSVQDFYLVIAKNLTSHFLHTSISIPSTI